MLWRRRLNYPPPIPRTHEAVWPDFHPVAVSQREVWGFMCFYADGLGRSVIAGNLIPNAAMTDATRFGVWFDRYNYEKAYKELNMPAPEKQEFDLTNGEIYVLMRAAHKDLGQQLETNNGNCKATCARLAELAALVKPAPVYRDSQ